jgi:pSer/pThr/pTyr-binding forkhead associated (FHA) protein
VQKLVVFRGDAVEKELRLGRGTVRIGRDNRNDLVLEDPSKGVSRFHAELRLDAGRYVVVDLKSRNGVWMNEERIKGKVALALGVPVTLGPYELVLEDDVSTGDFDVVTPPLNQHTVVNAASVNRKDASGGRPASRSQSMRSPVTATKRQALVWGSAAAVLIVCGILFAEGMHIYRQTRKPPLSSQAAVTEVTQEPPLPPVDPIKEQVNEHLTAAHEQMNAGDYEGALRDHIEPALELASDNAEALELKQSAEAAIAAAPPPPSPKTIRTTTTVPPTPAEPEAPGIPRRSSEANVDYTARVKRIEVDFNEGKSSLDKKDYAAALSHFRAVDREQPKYQGVDQLMTDTKNKQQKAFEEAMDGGSKNEQAGKLHDARVWYLTASHVDPASTTARDKAETLRTRTVADARNLDTRASFSRKAGETESAVRYYQQIVDLLLPGDDLFDNAKRELEALKR